MSTRTVRRPHERVQLNVVNQSSRSGPIVAIVLHDTESHDYPGTRDLEAIGSWFNNPSAQASAHVCVDEEGYSARYVHDSKKAWHCAGFNSATLGIEQIGYATYTRLLWKRNGRRQLRKVAKYIAYWHKAYGIPIRRGAVRNGVITRTGVLTHADLGVVGGGHHDPGPGYPIWLVLRIARRYAKGWK